jgi:EAL domain-containing protein (putative c-di-GMP-specific phosphodiesterase class I)
LSVNISPVQLKLPHFSDEIREIIRDVGIDICRITLEITENVLVEDLEAVSPILQELKDFGFGISLDDFGTGFSSLSYLNNLPINEIKIDRSFIDKILLSEQSRSLVKAIIAISESCDMHVVAEGVETEKQFNWLVEHHCDYVQGYYFDKPLSVHVLKERYGEPA